MTADESNQNADRWEADPIAHVVDYVAGMDPKFRSSIHGAAAAEIGMLEQLTGATLPPVYRSFLAHMGHSMDWISVYGSNFDIDSVIEFYQDPPWTVPQGHILIATAGEESLTHIYLRRDSRDLWRVVTFPQPFGGRVDEKHIEGIAGSLEEMIGRIAFRTVVMAVQPFSGRHYHRDPALGSVEQVADLAKARLGLSLEWFSNDWTAVCKGSDCGLIAMKPTGTPLVVEYAASTQETHGRVMRMLEREFGLIWLPMKIF